MCDGTDGTDGTDGRTDGRTRDGRTDGRTDGAGRSEAEPAGLWGERQRRDSVRLDTWTMFSPLQPVATHSTKTASKLTSTDPNATGTLYAWKMGEKVPSWRQSTLNEWSCGSDHLHQVGIEKPPVPMPQHHDGCPWAKHQVAL